MPVLDNPRHEAFALARARGGLLEDAYEDAGFASGNGHASRLASRPEVAERIAELREELRREADASPLAMIAAYLKVAQTAEKLGNHQGVEQARLALREAERIGEEAVNRRYTERNPRKYY